MDNGQRRSLLSKLATSGSVVLCALAVGTLVSVVPRNSEAQVSTGQTLYNANCKDCHGDPTTSTPDPGQDAPKIPGARLCEIQAALYGNPGGPGDPFPEPDMAFLRGLLSTTDLKAISDYLNSFRVTGKQRYATTCAACHGLDGKEVVGVEIAGSDSGDIREAISEVRAMNFLGCVPRADIRAIGRYLRKLEDDD